MQSSDKWLQGIQYFRAIAVIEIIALHALLVASWVGASAFGPLKLAVIHVFGYFTGFGVAHFVFISGVVLYNKYRHRFSLSMFYRRRVSSILPPYAVWSTFYFFYGYVAVLILLFFHYQGAFSGYSSLPAAEQVFIGYVNALATGINHLWFVVLILQLYVLYPLLVRLYEGRTRLTNPLYLLSVLALVQIVFTTFVIREDRQSLLSNLFVNFVFFFVLGFYVAERYDAIKARISNVSVLGLSLVVILSTIGITAFPDFFLQSSAVASYPALASRAMSFLYCLLLIVFYLRLCTAWESSPTFFTGRLERVGEDSLGIFLVHYFFILAFAGMLPKLGLTPYNLLFYPTLVILTLLSSYVSVQALYRLPFSVIILGKKRRRQTGEPSTSGLRSTPPSDL
ncbi:MAG: acyltransferase [Halobacteriota archaeon]